jgi:hypothetical protein
MTLTVTTIGLVGLMSLHLSVARGNDSASRFGEATQIANQQLESLRAQKLTDMLAALGASSLPIDSTRPTVAGRAGMTYRRRVLVQELTSASTSLWRIRVEVGWTDDGAAQGALGGTLDHLVAVELIRTIEEQL